MKSKRVDGGRHVWSNGDLPGWAKPILVRVVAMRAKGLITWRAGR